MINTPTHTRTVTLARPHVTQAQLDRCHPIFDYQRGEWFYQVDSESDPTIDPYEVRYHAHTDSYTCTCPAGAHAFVSCRTHRYCKHVYWACAHYQHVLRPQLRADVSLSSEQPPTSDMVAREDDWLNDVPRSDVASKRHPAVFVPPTWIKPTWIN